MINDNENCKSDSIDSSSSTILSHSQHARNERRCNTNVRTVSHEIEMPLMILAAR